MWVEIKYTPSQFSPAGAESIKVWVETIGEREEDFLRYMAKRIAAVPGNWSMKVGGENDDS